MARQVRTRKPQKRAAEVLAKPISQVAAAQAAKPKRKHHATVRMYRQGLGDCFLITIPRAEGRPFRIMIDCGVILGTADASVKMQAVMQSILDSTTDRDKPPFVDLLVATHQHWDHLSGFIQAKDLFDKLGVGEVWLAWTEDPADELATRLAKEREDTIAALRLAGAAMTLAGDGDGAAEISELLDSFGATGGGNSTVDALRIVKEKMKPGEVRYFLPGGEPVEFADPKFNIYVLGPPHDEKQLKKTLPSKKEPETYGLADFGAEIGTPLSGSDDETPFDGHRPIPFTSAQSMPFFQQHYWGPGAEAPDWRRIDSAWLSGASDLALALDSATNNTSLVLALEFEDGAVLLFVADAQVGNWLSWENVSFEVRGRERVTGHDLLARSVFYKVGHHGSHNATLRAKGLDLMTSLRIAAIPVNHQMAVKKRWGNMPLPELIEALEKKAKDGVVRIDEDPPKPIPGVTVDPLYFDISI